MAVLKTTSPVESTSDAPKARPRTIVPSSSASLACLMRTVISGVSPDSLFIIRDEPEPARFLRVVVERGIDDRGVDRPEGYVYAGDEANFPGERVVVPLGSRNRPAPGIVVAVGGRELLNGVDPRRVKRILRPSGASLPGDLLDLARWMSEYYFCLRRSPDDDDLD